METEKYQRKPFEVDALRVTEENFQFAAGLCSGEVRTKKDRFNNIVKYIKVFVNRPLNETQTEAYVGDWILYTPSGWKIYKDTAFRNCFEKVEPQVMSAGDIQKLYDEAVIAMANFKANPVGAKVLENSVIDVMQETQDWEIKAANLEGIIHRSVGLAMEWQDSHTAEGGSIDNKAREWRGKTTSELMRVVTDLFAPGFLKKTLKSDQAYRMASRPIPGLKPLRSTSQTYFPAKLSEDEVKGAQEALRVEDEVTTETLEKVADKLKHLDDEVAEKEPVFLTSESQTMPELDPELREQLLAESKSVAQWMLDTELKLPGTFTDNQIRAEFQAEGKWHDHTQVLPVVEPGLRKFQKQSIDYIAPVEEPGPRRFQQEYIRDAILPEVRKQFDLSPKDQLIEQEQAFRISPTETPSESFTRLVKDTAEEMKKLREGPQ